MHDTNSSKHSNEQQFKYKSIKLRKSTVSCKLTETKISKIKWNYLKIYHSKQVISLQKSEFSCSIRISSGCTSSNDDCRYIWFDINRCIKYTLYSPKHLIRKFNPQLSCSTSHESINQSVDISVDSCYYHHLSIHQMQCVW